MWNNVKQVRKNQIPFEDHAYAICIPLDITVDYILSWIEKYSFLNRKIEGWWVVARCHGKASRSFNHVGQLLPPLNPYPRAHSLWIIYYAVIIVSANGVTRTTFHATVRAESRNCSHELRALGSDHGNHRSRGWLAPLIHAATDFFPPPFYRSPRHRLDLVTWAWRNASYLLFCVSTSPRDLDAADRSRREQWWHDQ